MVSILEGKRVVKAFVATYSHTSWIKSSFGAAEA